VDKLGNCYAGGMQMDDEDPSTHIQEADAEYARRRPRFAEISDSSAVTGMMGAWRCALRA